MKTILLMRHAKSSWKEIGKTDKERQLNSRGVADAPRMGKRLKRKGYVLDKMISSTATRAMMTAKSVAEAMHFEGEIHKEDRLYLADIDEYMNVLTSLDESVKDVMILSHNPGTEWMIEYLSGRTFTIATAAYVRLGFEGKWAKLGEKSCKVLDYDFPKSELSR